MLTFVTLDGVMQAPGAREEDRDGGFTHGGWLVPYFDEVLGKAMTDQMAWPFDLLLGRRTYRIFESHWPHVKGEQTVDNINRATKYIVSHRPQKLEWQGSKLITGDVVGAIKNLKAQDGPVLQVHGSSHLIQTLLKDDLVGELWLKIFPVAVGAGKRLFGANKRDRRSRPGTNACQGAAAFPRSTYVCVISPTLPIDVPSMGESLHGENVPTPLAGPWTRTTMGRLRNQSTFLVMVMEEQKSRLGSPGPPHRLSPLLSWQ